MDDESGDDNRDELTSEWGGESRRDWRGWRNESGSWFQWRGDAYLNERSVIFNEYGWWPRKCDNRWGAGTARGLNRDQIVKIARLTGCKNFVGKRKKFILYSMSNNGLPLKSGLGVIQSHWNWQHLIDRLRVPTGVRSTITMDLSCIVSEIKQTIRRECDFFSWPICVRSPC